MVKLPDNSSPEDMFRGGRGVDFHKPEPLKVGERALFLCGWCLTPYTNIRISNRISGTERLLPHRTEIRKSEIYLATLARSYNRVVADSLKLRAEVAINTPVPSDTSLVA